MAKRDTPRTGRHFTRRETPRRTDGRRIRTRSRQGPAPTARAAHREAQQQLRRFRKGSALAVALTALLLLVWQPPAALEGQTAGTEPVVPDPSVAVGESAATIRELALGFYAFLPRILLVLLVVALAVVLGRIARGVLERTLRGWERTAAITAVTRLVIFLVAAVSAVSILAGDVRAVVGSVGLLGLAASWALQTPIESFTGWLLNSFRGYYRVGDRILVGEVFGDVSRIDILTTTVWEAGGAGKAVAAAQPTGALITFPNWEVLRSNVVNYSRDFPYVWDEIATSIANESDLAYAMRVIEGTARRVLGDEMAAAAQQYEHLLRAAHLPFVVEELPRAYLSGHESWTVCTVRYLVPVRSRRHWASTLTLEISREIARAEHARRILPAYPRRETVAYERWPAPEQP